jgi:hypothetical protein
MNNFRVCAVGLAAMVALAGCETTNSIPYKASTNNVIAIQQTMKAAGKTVRLGEVAMAEGVEESPLCRLMGLVKVAPGKTLREYIKDAFQEELFMAGAYAADAPVVIDARITALSFSSISPASWEITMDVKSNKSPGYTVTTKYPFNTSFPPCPPARTLPMPSGRPSRSCSSRWLPTPSSGAPAP